MVIVNDAWNGSFQGFDRSGNETTEFTYFSAAYAPRSVEQIGVKQVSSEVTSRKGGEERKDAEETSSRSIDLIYTSG